MKYKVVQDNVDGSYAIYYKKNFFSPWTYFAYASSEERLDEQLDKLQHYREKYTIIEKEYLED